MQIVPNIEMHVYQNEKDRLAAETVKFTTKGKRIH